MLILIKMKVILMIIMRTVKLKHMQMTRINSKSRTLENLAKCVIYPEFFVCRSLVTKMMMLTNNIGDNHDNEVKHHENILKYVKYPKLILCCSMIK